MQCRITFKHKHVRYEERVEYHLRRFLQAKVESIIVMKHGDSLELELGL